MPRTVHLRLPPARSPAGLAYYPLVGKRNRTQSSAEVWDPATASFAPAGSLAEARMTHTPTPLADGLVLVVGGSGIEGGLTNDLASAEVSC